MQQDPLIGTTLGNYTILAPLGQGGMAHVYRACQENLNREVAVKVLPPWYATDRNFVERFHREARLVARLSHPNIVTIHDFSENQGHLYIVMQLVDGGTLKHKLDAAQSAAVTGIVGGIDLEETNRIFQQLASALNYAHENGIIHRDIKPVNVLMERSGRPILSDFGIAKVLAGNSGLTRPGAGVGTPEYMSPEQCRGEEEVDGRADIYALGVMLYESLTGRTPFVGDNYHALAHSHLYLPPPDPRIYNPQLASQVCQVILTALQKQPAMRYQQANDLALALEQAVHPSSIGDISLQPTQRPGGIERAPTSPIYACPNCQRPNKPDTYFCVRCGSLLNQCPKCRSQNRARDRFCTHCGQALLYRLQ
ncbi:MAG TPA: serine/threonine-protein kinase [Ktedonobacteraceae bacterium]|nr:serine/threonine-protein kinase [Ktedonobacteraceae bacterium]